MKLMGNWTDKVDGVDDVLAEDINSIARAVISIEEANGDIEAALDAIIAIQESLIPPTFIVKHTTTEEITTFEFKKGMTWAEWCDSEYNTAEYFCSGDYVYGGNLSAYIYDDYSSGIMARPEDVIKADHEYQLNQF